MKSILSKITFSVLCCKTSNTDQQKTRGNGTSYHLNQILIRCNRQENIGAVSTWAVVISLLKITTADFYYCMIISQAILDVSWLMSLRAQTNSHCLRWEADDTILFYSCWRERGTVFTPPTTYVHTILGMQESYNYFCLCWYRNPGSGSLRKSINL